MTTASFSETVSKLDAAMPKGFPFYHLGEISQASEPQPGSLELEDKIGVAFSLAGEIRGALILLLDEGLDVSMYSEAGNIIASRIADATGAVISPPQPMTRSQIERLMRSQTPALRRPYVHFHGNHRIALEALILIAPAQGGAAHA